MIATLMATMRAFYRVEAAASPDGRTIERDGLTAAIEPSAPAQSVLNCVIADEPGAGVLARELDGLAAAYRAEGVTHWMVWTTPGDAAAAALLREAGHLCEYEPLAMALSLDALAPAADPPALSFELDRDPHPVEITTLNERANGEPPGAFGAAFAGLRDARFGRWAARVDGRARACLVTFDDGANRMVQWVATDPGAQRRGLARGLLHAALADARERGLRTSTLESSYEGERLYAGLGYAPLGRLGMWLRDDGAV